MLRTKWTVQRCQGQASTLAIAAAQPLVLVGDAQAHALEPAPAQLAQELGPERLRLDLAQVEADHLAPACLVHGVGDHERLRADVALVAHLQLLRIEPQVGVVALERTLAEQLHLLVQRPAERRDAVLGHPLDPQLLNQAVDLARGDAVHVRLQHDRDDRLLRARPRLQEGGEVRRPRALARDRE